MSELKVVGGVLDGRSLWTNEDKTHFLDVDKPSNEFERYVLRKFQYEQGSIRIWALDSLTEYDVLKRLIEGYHGNEQAS